jgi:hypothetical protein
MFCTVVHDQALCDRGEYVPATRGPMSFSFDPETRKGLETVLGTVGKDYGNHVRFEISGPDPLHNLALEIYSDIAIGAEAGALVNVYTPNANLQLQHCSGIIISELMGEVTFVAESCGKISGLIVERNGGCSMYSNVDRSLLSGDFTKLGPEVILSSIALSLTETILPDFPEDEDK